MDNENFGSFQHCYYAYKACRRHKRKSAGVLQFEHKLLDELSTLSERLQTRQWRPSRSVCFVVTRPKAREIHAAAFADRVVHHLLVPELEQLYEPVFIYDSYSNRTGKGTHSAVERLQGFMRSVREQSSPHDGYYLQLDIRNFFNRINREILYDLLKRHLEKMGRKGKISPEKHQWLRWLSHRLLETHPARNVVYVGNPPRHCVPEHKRLAAASARCGLPIGNLTSQFFANVYLNELDQFIKRRLPCRHYLRYVDDFVLLHPDRQQLQVWQGQIEAFLAEKLHLDLRAATRLAPLGNGIDFLGYVVRADYRLVRNRVIAHLHEKLQSQTCRLTAEPYLDLRNTDLDALHAMLASYLGHCRHANSYHLLVALWRQYSWLGKLFTLNPASSSITPRWKPLQANSLKAQWHWFRQQWPEHLLIMQLGWRFMLFAQDATCCHADLRLQTWLHPVKKVRFKPEMRPAVYLAPAVLSTFLQHLRLNALPYVLVEEQGFLRSGLKQRVAMEYYYG